MLERSAIFASLICLYVVVVVKKNSENCLELSTKLSLLSLITIPLSKFLSHFVRTIDYAVRFERKLLTQVV